jgi:alkylation response protein AidB-like acyl-CoA dehydrogenase
MQVREQILSDKLLHQFAERAAAYDRENRFFHEDFDDLRDAGYLTIPVPKELGGAGFTLAHVCREQRRLAYYAPATALGINMHLYWVGVAADLWRQGDRSLEWMLKERWRARCSTPPIPSAATICRYCCRPARLNESMAGSASPATKCSAA